ncbi:hypothetical protein RND81_14G167300 [Saponaria officinalis]|uniref:Myb/SANT-like DNA-binding domain-containing protein n=1 Tax=Saponaria officinalis TaxID=3572 RepID=A0AAW1GMS0_SAPOF
MDGSENDLRYQTKASSVNNQQGYSTSIRLKVPSHNAAMHSRVINQSAVDCNEDDVDGKEIGVEVEKIGGVRMIGKDSYDDEDDDDVSDDDDDEVEVEEDDDNNDNGIGRLQKKRKMKNSVSNYEFVPRVRTPPAHVAVQSEPSAVGRGIGERWSDRESFALLDAWGDRFMKLGRKSLCSEDWKDVADTVTRETNVVRTESQCRSRLEALKKKYRREKTRSTVSNWVFFGKLDLLLSSPAQRPSSLSCGVDSGEYVFVNPKVYLNRANGLDEMRDSPENSECSKEDQDGSNGRASKGKGKKRRKGDGSCFQLLADSIQKFSNIYEDIESDKRKQMVDLENMRMDFQRQTEMQTRQILERAQAEIVKIRHHNAGDENDVSAENCSK